ncbi:MAG: fumarylacetoacetate hydrolase family protein [Methylococcales bacterium]|nr:fumarylacetoacetate hydrolase family protein [Methylococcales bacterium]
MKLITFTHNQQTRIGAVINNKVIDTLDNPNIATSMIEFLAQGDDALTQIRQQIKTATTYLNLNEVKLLAPIPNPSKFLGIGLNYADHVNETERSQPEFPVFFNKQPSCIIAHGEAIHLPKVSDKLDYECELAFVIGKRCRHVPKNKAHLVIAGYTIVNDVTVRDWQIRTPTWTMGKSFDTHGPIGPYLVTADEISDPHQLNLKTWVDGQLRQSSNTAHMLFNCYEMIAYLTTVMTLEPGDIISTGTPAGVGVKMSPRGYLKAGQTVKIEIEKIGILSNPVIDEPDNLALY